MPVPQSGTATTVVSTGTYDVARFGIEGQSVRTGRAVVNPTTCDAFENCACSRPRNELLWRAHAERIREPRASTHADYLVRDLCCAPA
jgi:hypothetical protein